MDYGLNARAILCTDMATGLLTGFCREGKFQPFKSNPGLPTTGQDRQAAGLGNSADLKIGRGLKAADGDGVF